MSPEGASASQPEKGEQLPRYEAGKLRAAEHRDDFEQRMAGLVADVQEAQLQIKSLREKQATEQSLMKNLKSAEGIKKAQDEEEATLREIATWERKVIDTMDVIESEKRSLLN